MCTVHRPLPADSPFSKAFSDEEKAAGLQEWYCPDQSATCWQKGHEFYLPMGIWGKQPRLRYDPSGCPKTICAAIGSIAYKKTSEWLVLNGVLSSAPKSRGRKRKQFSQEMASDMEPVNHGGADDDDEETFHECIFPHTSDGPNKV
jgi:hypothetical protein